MNTINWALVHRFHAKGDAILDSTPQFGPLRLAAAILCEPDEWWRPEEVAEWRRAGQPCSPLLEATLKAGMRELSDLISNPSS